MKKFCSSLREHATNVKKILPLTKKSENYIRMSQHVIFVEKIFKKVC